MEREDLETDLKNFLKYKEVKYLTILEYAFSDVKELLEKNRFIPMNKNYCYDKNINGCWLGLCESGFKYMNSFNLGSNYQKVLKELREFYKNQDIDIPTKDELKKLTNLSNAPFDLSFGRPSNPSDYCLYKKNSGYTQTYDLDSWIV